LSDRGNLYNMHNTRTNWHSEAAYNSIRKSNGGAQLWSRADLVCSTAIYKDLYFHNNCGIYGILVTCNIWPLCSLCYNFKYQSWDVRVYHNTQMSGYKVSFIITKRNLL